MWALKTAMKMPKGVQVEWEDGLLASFNYVWLRDNSQRRPCLVHLDLNTKPEAVDCSKHSLSLVWPHFNTANYSSDFLRHNINCQKSAALPTTPSSSSSLSTPSTSISSKIINSLLKPISYASDKAALLDSNISQVVPITQLRPEETAQVVGQVYWHEIAHEPGTVWPHLSTVPSVCMVESLTNETANLMLVDTCKALEQLSQKYPEEFEFLSQCMLEYCEMGGSLRSHHPVCQILDGQIVPGVFNNAARSSTIVVQPLEKLYESLQKFGRICAESIERVQLHPGQRLLVDNHKAMLGAPAQRGRSLLIRCLA